MFRQRIRSRGVEIFHFMHVALRLAIFSPTIDFPIDCVFERSLIKIVGLSSVGN